MRGLAEALADPDAAAESAFALAEAGGNPSFLSIEGETFRWQTDAALLRESYATGDPYGVPDLTLLQAEVDAYEEVGVFTEELPELAEVADLELAASVYDETGAGHLADVTAASSPEHRFYYRVSVIDDRRLVAESPGRPDRARSPDSPGRTASPISPAWTVSAGWRSPPSSPSTSASTRCSGGYLGVSLFFTLSGFLIGTLILNEIVTTGRFSLAEFWRRRARRLLPPAVITLAIVAVGRVITADLAATTPGDIVASGLDVANWHFLAEGSSYDDLFNGPSAVLHFWSLAIEEQFYLVVGLLAVLVARRSKRPVRVAFFAAMATAIASFLVPIVVNADVDRIYYGTDTRAGEVMVGVAASAVLVSARRRTVILGRSRLIAAGASLRLDDDALPVARRHAGYRSQCAAVCCRMTAACSLLLVLGALLPTGPVAAISRARPIVWLGGISYALYLVHWPVIVIADRVTDSRSLLRSATIVTISVVLAQLSAVVVEHPIRRRQATVRPLALAGVALVSVVGFTVVVQGRSDDHRRRCSAVLRRPRTATPRPLPSLSSSAPRVAMFGDSVGLSLLLALGNTAVVPEFSRAPSELDLGCGIALSPSPPPNEPDLCADPAGRFAAKAIRARRRRGGDGLVPVGASRPAASGSRRRAVRHR